ncbi:NEAT domain-containing protein [Clostridium celatum]|uniref:Iron transport-associated domain protein n=1 Tax=Clostridium celatum DSM 1785 TaxID=545697 RepID=L1QK41_9CLOT|nr:NEAT domain-containing protein [Clostridium celatum]EKY28359.1 iron transport-associated domain protein [Clostridium celatum DSM 1785]MCE9655242.1 NEAT domain-containing protein [Clostridium celatum]MDU2265423.1 NEAT domain-containing protein [Clostridium celatum]MDU3724024.1 NEAT domain-containing protein [Clostridium celatum]MDU6295153.1 NEAT domain-containing protein [Clostridium celatum]
MKKNNKFRQVIMAMMFLGMFLTIGTINVHASDIKSGIYEVENDVYHESETGMAMSRTYLLPTMTVEVTKDHIIYTVGFSGSNYMENYRMKLNGEDAVVEIVEENSEDGIVKLNIEVDKVDADMDALIYVGPMERDVQFKVIPKMETLTLIEEIVEEDNSEVNTIEEADVDADVTTEELNIENENNIVDSSDNSDNIKPIVIGLGVVIVLLIVGLTIIKAKKKSA